MYLRCTCLNTYGMHDTCVLEEISNKNFLLNNVTTCDGWYEYIHNMNL